MPVPFAKPHRIAGFALDPGVTRSALFCNPPMVVGAAAHLACLQVERLAAYPDFPALLEKFQPHTEAGERAGNPAGDSARSLPATLLWILRVVAPRSRAALPRWEKDGPAFAMLAIVAQPA